MWVDKNPDMSYQINKVASHYKILRDIRRIRSVLSQKHTEMLVHSLISSRIDYCNSLFLNIDKSNIDKLQKVQNTAARLIVRKRKKESISATIKELHWLRVDSRIIFKILLLVYKSINGTSSKNIELEFKSNTCREDDFLKLKLHFFKTKYGKRTFKYNAPRLWNALPVHIRKVENIDVFKKMVKTLLIQDTDGFKAKAFKYNYPRN